MGVEVPQEEPAIAGDDPQDVVEVVGYSAGEEPDGLHFLCLLELCLGVPAGLTLLDLPEPAGHRRSQAGELALGDEVDGPGLHGLHRILFPHRARNDDERRLDAKLAPEGQGRGGGKAGHVKIRDDHVPGLRAKGLRGGLRRFDSLPSDFVSALLESEDDECGIVLPVLHEQDAQRRR